MFLYIIVNLPLSLSYPETSTLKYVANNYHIQVHLQSCVVVFKLVDKDAKNIHMNNLRYAHKPKTFNDVVSQLLESSSGDEENYRNSGTGILEFSPEKAGQDVTPANFQFSERDRERRHTAGTFSSIAGGWGWTVTGFCKQYMWINTVYIIMCK